MKLNIKMFISLIMGVLLFTLPVHASPLKTKPPTTIVQLIVQLNADNKALEVHHHDYSHTKTLYQTELRNVEAELARVNNTSSTPKIEARITTLQKSETELTTKVAVITEYLTVVDSRMASNKSYVTMLERYKAEQAETKKGIAILQNKLPALNKEIAAIDAEGDKLQAGNNQIFEAQMALSYSEIMKTAQTDYTSNSKILAEKGQDIRILINNKKLTQLRLGEFQAALHKQDTPETDAQRKQGKALQVQADTARQALEEGVDELKPSIKAELVHAATTTLIENRNKIVTQKETIVGQINEEQQTSKFQEQNLKNITTLIDKLVNPLQPEKLDPDAVINTKLTIARSEVSALQESFDQLARDYLAEVTRAHESESSLSLSSTLINLEGLQASIASARSSLLSSSKIGYLESFKNFITKVVSSIVSLKDVFAISNQASKGLQAEMETMLTNVNDMSEALKGQNLTRDTSPITGAVSVSLNESQNIAREELDIERLQHQTQLKDAQDTVNGLEHDQSSWYSNPNAFKKQYGLTLPSRHAGALYPQDNLQLAMEGVQTHLKTNQAKYKTLYNALLTKPEQKAAWGSYLEAYNASPNSDAESLAYAKLKASLGVAPGTFGLEVVEKIESLRGVYNEMGVQNKILYQLQQVYNVEPLEDSIADIDEVYTLVDAGKAIPAKNSKGEAYAGMSSLAGIMDGYNKAVSAEERRASTKTPDELDPIITTGPIIEPIPYEPPPYDPPDEDGDE